jgi:outer membrane protein TolC
VGLVVAGCLGGPVGCFPERVAVPADALRQRVLAPPEACLPEPAPAEAPPPADLPAAEAPPPPRPAGPAEEAPPGADACPGARTLTLAEALRLTEKVNPHLHFLAARAEQARSGELVAGADFLPSALARFRHIDGGPSPFTFPTQPPPGTVGVVTLSDKLHEHDQSEVYLEWLLYDFGRRRGRLEQATLATEVAQLQYRRGVQTADLNVTVAYYDLLRGLTLRRIAEETVRRAEANLRDARNLLRTGAAVRNDVLRAEVFLADAQLALVAAERAVGVARAALNDAIGINVSCPTDVADVRDEPAFSLPLADALRIAVDSREEFAVVLRTVRSAQAGWQVAKADFFPKVNVSAAANWLNEEARPGELYDAGVNIELSLFEGGKRVGRLRGADAEVRGTIAQGQEVCNRIALEVHTAWLGVEEARQRIRLARTALTQATENLRLILNLFRKGEAIATEVIDAELALVRAQQNDATALYDYHTALARLAYAVGLPAGTIPGGSCPTPAGGDGKPPG